MKQLLMLMMLTTLSLIAYGNKYYLDPANGSITNVSYYIGRPKFMLGADGFTPTHLLGGAGSPVKTSPMTSLTIVSPLAGGL